MAVLLPGAPDLAAYWRNLVGGVDAITEVPEGRWDADYYDPGAASGPAAPDRLYCRRGGFVDDYAQVQPTRFGIMPSSVPGTEPDQLIALQVAAAAIADAGGPDRLPDRDRIGVVLGRGGYLTPGLVRLDQRVRSAHQLVRTLGELLPELTSDQLHRVRHAFTDRLGPDRPESAIGLVPNLAASRLANRLDLRGPAYTVDAACASSLVAVDQAVGELASGRCDAVITGGVHHCHDVTLWSVFAQLRALSPSQRIRPFHRDADGILIGEGTGVVVLKRLADAQRDGDRVYAVIRGTGVAGDGRTAALANPDPGGQIRAVRAAWRAAGLDPAAPGALGLLEAHGTATPAGDAAELATLAEVFGPARAGVGVDVGAGAGTGAGDGRAVLGSVKSMIGHTMPAAGVAGLVKAALAVHHGVLLPTLHCDDPHPALAATRFRTVPEARPWEPDPSGSPRRAGVNAFGFGGINAHVVLEQAPDSGRSPAFPAPRPGATATRPPSTAPAPRVAAVTEPERVLRLAADRPDRLAALLAADDSALLAAGLPEHGGPAPRCRLAVVDPTPKRLALARRTVAKGQAWRGRNDVWFAPEPLLGAEPRRSGTGRIAFLFPGLEGEFDPRTDDVADHFGLPRPASTSDTGSSAAQVAQVADIGRHGAGVVAVGRLLDGALRRMGVTPDAVAGHSVGEWTAMIAGGLYSGTSVDSFLTSFDPDALHVPGLTFAALGLSAQRVEEALATLDGMSEVVLSHDNAPQQSIVCGPEPAVVELVRWFRTQGVLGQVLPFRSGFHTPMLAPYLAPIRQAADSFELHRPTVPVWSGTTAAPFPEGEAEVRALFLRHLLEPVRFRPLIEALYAAGFRAFVQVGTGQLASLVSDTLHGRDHLTIAANSPHRDGLAQLRRVAAALWTHGAEPDAGVLAAAPEPGAVPAAAPERVHPSVRLDLGGALVSLDSRTLPALRAELRPAPARAAATGRASALTSLAESFPLAAELDALLRDTEQVAAELVHAELIHAGRRNGAGPALPPAPAWPPVAASATTAAPPPTRAPAATPPATSAPAPAAAPSSAPHGDTLRVSVEAMPYLLDHCFIRQRAGWPDLTDRWPVVPATTIVQHLMDAAERTAPGRVTTAVHGLRFGRWVPAAEPLDVQITLRDAGDGQLVAAFGDFASGTVELAGRHPTPPAPWPVDPAAERAPEHTASTLYQERWMFHGPAFQGLTELTALGESQVRGVITAPSAPGALLDNVGQLLGYWIMATRTERTVVFPVGLSELRLYGPAPRPGTEVHCHIRITALTGDALEADVQLTCGGTVWAEAIGWRDRRFDSHPETRPTERCVERNTLSAPQPGGWSLVHERWPDLATRDLVLRNHLGSAERARYEQQPPRGRRAWLLGRIAAKDAVRQWLWAQGEGPVFPAEIEVLNDPGGRPRVRGVHGRTLPDLDISLAHRSEIAVAIVRPSDAASGVPGGGPSVGPGVGIDIEEVVEREPETIAVALGPAERALLAACRAASDRAASTSEAPDRDRPSTDPAEESEALWFARFWAAKEAVAKAQGTGLQGRPRAFEVVAADPTRLLVAVAGPDGTRTIRLHCTQLSSPPDLPPRRYVVAWTADGTEGTALTDISTADITTADISTSNSERTVAK
ncbi:beta-ketoacyl synthase N-terminal-like domain-containing protein [Streptacidiphilus sp. EB129]|uniref:type I polyketide synthase n=1 Tax=Streptacidiphilus sp. EB129 TaxID=3156262 RepID=UPI0035184147